MGDYPLRAIPEDLHSNMKQHSLDMKESMRSLFIRFAREGIERDRQKAERRHNAMEAKGR